ncbi:MAG: Bax inhibitor-1 family protein [Bryobacter sp.]|nr:Bax inhibitor-1 family protein [Bryobacter sp.]
MNYSRQNMSLVEKLSTATPLSARQSAVIKQTYGLFAVSVFCAILGGYVGGTSETMARLFSGWIGWILAIAGLNVIPMIALAVRHNPFWGTGALVFNGFFAGLVLSPILWVASRVNPALILAALAITGIVFLAVTAFIFSTGRTFSAPRGLMVGMFFAIIGAVVINSFLNIGLLGILISAGIGIMGVIALVSSTSGVLNSPDADSPIPGALALFAGVFNIFVAALNILLRLMGGGRRD